AGSSGGASAPTRTRATSAQATRIRPAQTAKTLPVPPTEMSTPVSRPAPVMAAASTQPMTTFAAVSWSGEPHSDGMSVDWAGRVVVTAVEALTAPAYATNGAPAMIAAAAMAIPAALAR